MAVRACLVCLHFPSLLCLTAFPAGPRFKSVPVCPFTHPPILNTPTKRRPHTTYQKAFLPQLVAWLRAPITGDLLEVPGIDDSHAVEKLAGANIETTHQLIGHYLMHKYVMYVCV